MSAEQMRAERDRVRAEALGRQLIRLGHELLNGRLPVPSGTVSLSYYLRGDLADQQRRALDIARTIGGEWRPRRSGAVSRYVSAEVTLLGYESLADGSPYGPGSLEVSVNVDPGEPEPVVHTPDERLAAELNAVVDGNRQALIAAMSAPSAAAALKALGLAEGESTAGCSCGARFPVDELDEHLAVCPLSDGEAQQ